MTERDKNISFYEALAHERALDEAEKTEGRKPTAEERESIARMKARAAEAFQRRRAELRDQLAAETQARAKGSVPARIIAMTRDAVLARLAELRELASGGAPILVEARDHVGDTPVEELSLADLQWLLAAFEDELGEPPTET